MKLCHTILLLTSCSKSLVDARLTSHAKRFLRSIDDIRYIYSYNAATTTTATATPVTTVASSGGIEENVKVLIGVGAAIGFTALVLIIVGILAAIAFILVRKTLARRTVYTKPTMEKVEKIKSKEEIAAEEEEERRQREMYKYDAFGQEELISANGDV
jgi:hypothetical protein